MNKHWHDKECTHFQFGECSCGLNSPHTPEEGNKPCGNCHKDHEGRTLCDFTPEESWEKSFDDRFKVGSNNSVDSVITNAILENLSPLQSVVIKCFISETLATQKTTIKKMIENRATELETQIRSENNGELVTKNEPHNSWITGKYAALQDILHKLEGI